MRSYARISFPTGFLLFVAVVFQNDRNFASAFSLSSMTSTFVGSHSRSVMVGTAKNAKTSSRIGLSMLIDTLSSDAILALKEAHKLGNNLGLSTLQKELLFTGFVMKPERARKTLEKYGMTPDLIRESAIKVIKKKKNQATVLSPDSSPLPFTKNTKQILTDAGSIAEKMESEVIRSEHVLLALMGYNNGERIKSSYALEVLQNIQKLEKFSVFQFCEDLVNSLPNIAYEVEYGAEAISIGGPGNTPLTTLQDVGVDFTQMAIEGKLDAVYGRNNEIRMALRTLGRRRKNNPCLIGDPGVGKTAVAEGIAQVLAQPIIEAQQQAAKTRAMTGPPKLPKISNPFKKGDDNKNDEDVVVVVEEEIINGNYSAISNLPPCPEALKGFRLINVELATLVAGTTNRGDFEKKIKNLINEATNNKVVLFIDEIHNLLGTGGGGDGAMNAANLLKPALARGELRILGATTTPEYRRYIEKDGALERRFQPLVINEPTVDETIDILAAIMPRYEEYHGVEYTSNAILAAARLSNRYINDRFLPDKAIDILDEAGSMVKMVEDEELDNYFVTEDAITRVVSELSGIPVGKLDTDEKSRLLNLEAEMEKRIKGQSQAVRAVAKSIRRARSGMRDGKRPVASFLFCGPTGVGKTELCKALADTYYGREKDMIRIDMSEYMDRFSTSRLVGAPPGYVGYEEGGQLTEAVRRKPHSVILFDELEKAHEDVLNLLLQIMDEGTLTDGKGRTVNFKNTIFVMTSNVGSKDILNAARDMGGEVTEKQLTSDIIENALEEALKPELLNRIDEIIVFNPLSYENLKAIADNLVDEAGARAAEELNLKLHISDNISEIITREALKSASLYGARPIRRAVQRYLEDTLAEGIMNEFIGEFDEVSVDLANPKANTEIVKITRVSSLEGKKETIKINVGNDKGISDSKNWEAAYGDLPPLGPPKRDTDGFQ